MEIGEFRKKEFERRDARLKYRQPMKLKKSEMQKDKLHIVYVMTWTGICGGTKIILQHCNKLTERGHKATIICHFSKPNWFAMDERISFIQVALGEVLCEYIPKCDIIVATYWKEIYECVEQNVAPVIYFEQGDIHLFDQESIDAYTMEHIRNQIQIAPFIYTVSTFAKEKLREVFDVEVAVISNAVDKNIFYYTPHKKEGNSKIVITAIGSENVHFKCISNIVVAIQILKKIGNDIEFIWISPDQPNKLTTIPVIVNPSQKEIGNCLQRSDIFVCASLYESFCLPVLEAMMCGAAVITTDNGGVRDFVKDNVNAIVIEKNSISDMINKLTILINDKTLRYELVKAALVAAEEFDWEHTTDKLIDFYRNIASYEVLPN